MNSSDQFAENKDTSWSDNWTVLDSSHLKDDGDLSDAESVEVLESEGQSDENTVDEESEETSTFVADTGVLTDSLLSKLTQEIDEGAPTSVDHVGNTAKANDNVDALPQNNCTDNSTSILFKLKQFFFKVERIEFSIPTVLLEIIWYSLLFDMLLVTYLGVSYLAGLAENHPFEALKAHKSHQQYELDPLVLQLSHVVAEWKKYPLDDHSLDRHMLKTLFLYYGGSTELSANLHTLTEKVQKHNELLKNLGKEHYNKDEGQHLMAVSGHLAHSVACILGKQDQIVVPADMYLAANHSNDQHQDFAPDPGFWLNDWHLPQYFKANNTYYRIDSKPFVPPMQNFFVNLGSAGWNHYFWNLYHGIKDDNLVRDETTAGITTEQISESELDVEETERSPLDSILGDEALSFEKSSKTVFEIENNRQDGMGVLNPLNDVDSGLEEVAHNDEFEALGNYFKVLNEKNYLDDNRDGLNNHECVDKWCRLHEESSTPLVGQSKRQEKALKTGKLIQLFEEVSEDNSRNEDVLLKAESKKPLSDDLTEFSDSYLLNKFENWQVFDEENKKAFGKGKLNKLFAEILQEESHTEDLNAARKTETLSKEKKIVDAFEESDTLKMRSKIRSSFNESQEERKSILKESKSKDKFRRENRENMKHRRKQKNKGKESYGSGKAEREVNKKRKKKNFQKELKSEVSEKNRMSKRKDKSREKININPNNIEDKISDWNTRMVKGREQLRAQSGRKDDEMWLFERAKARHDMREETFYQ